MNPASSRRRFRQRIELERQVLAKVNGSLSATKPLAGITEASVFQWLRDVEMSLPSADAEAITGIILEIAKRSSLDSDCSRDVFEDNELSPVDSIGDLLFRLNDTLQKASSKGQQQTLQFGARMQN